MRIKNKHINIDKFLIAIIMIVIFGFVLLCYLIKIYTYPGSSFREIHTCIAPKAIEQKDHVLVTEKGVCVLQPSCTMLDDLELAKCLNNDTGGSWKILSDYIGNAPKIEKVVTKETGGYEIVNFGSQFDNRALMAFVITINNKEYFYWKSKGDGRFFEIDFPTFEYLGNDQYEDKNGLIYKNKRVETFPSLEDE